MVYTYDEFNRLTSYADLKGNRASYEYYADGLRKSKKIKNETTNYYYDGQNVVNETKNGNLYATNVVGVNGYISRTQNGEQGYFTRDAHGDIMTVYGVDGTTKLANYLNDAWGREKETAEIEWGKANPIRYAGQYLDSESGMYYLRARYYDPQIGRFISEDPIKDGLNWYGYCGGNPVNRWDPSGLKSDLALVYEQVGTLLSTKVHYMSNVKQYNNEGGKNGPNAEAFDSAFETDHASANKTRENISLNGYVMAHPGLKKLVDNNLEGATVEETSMFFVAILYVRDQVEKGHEPTYEELCNISIAKTEGNAIYVVGDCLPQDKMEEMIYIWLETEVNVSASNIGILEWNGKQVKEAAIPNEQEEVLYGKIQ